MRFWTSSQSGTDCQSSKHREAVKMNVQITRCELSNDKAKLFELAVMEKSLPATPDEVGIKWVQEVAGPIKSVQQA